MPCRSEKLIYTLRECRDYFEAEFVKTVDLDPSKNYLFGSHPHGVYCYGLLPSFISTRSLRKVFPGLNVRISTLDVNWFIPFWREIQIAFGTCSVSRKSLEHVLTKMGPGASVVIVVGGAAEALRARKGTNDILLGRKGFVKVAIQTGASLVPTFTFGENDLYHQLTPETWPPIASFHTWMKKKLTFSVPLIWGAFWFFPRKVKMAVVAGAPIEVEKQADPSDEYINEIHKQYVKALEELYDAHKERFAKGRRRDLKIFDALE
ncbi:diacylglycerol O-acyltransferase 1 [Rhizophlyctis rosea]|uniref:diacylglycerol O-acyltransferase n=1 Tax=Rhizophlyctis rosea TaxID=64517 RepID=A0AAD5SB28_9FUNG|nr:diacylglycerol O-acyltransferase 1 [Rhizophlyctis rosea]